MERRVEDVKSGKVETVPGKTVFKEIHERFSNWKDRSDME